MYNRWVYPQSDGTFLYGVNRRGAATVHTQVSNVRDDQRIWDQMIRDLEGQPAPAEIVVHTGQYL